MSDFLPKEVREGLERARMAALRKRSRLCVHTGPDVFPILKFWERGFSLEAKNAPHIRGLVDIFDGSRHLYQCLIVASETHDDEIHFDFKRATVAADRAALDFAVSDNAPVALIGHAG
ncbi:hypothetical protein [Falsihalocynthiibacter arcticus]|uniref:Uncharacterized protein n=1 Tax=Falsihalocynthiibacter arcticus TaxID=1579316 RepID=A0A126UYT9_9RHOB|nr:hypothetical protein [Falsihalocynthiibacter arcticus]AML51242.1 hypothetical protein RC74_08235 [Falsihalocynthiibacter arcticus]